MEKLKFSFFETISTDFRYQAIGFTFCIVMPCYVDVSQIPHLFKSSNN